MGKACSIRHAGQHQHSKIQPLQNIHRTNKRLWDIKPQSITQPHNPAGIERQCICVYRAEARNTPRKPTSYTRNRRAKPCPVKGGVKPGERGWGDESLHQIRADGSTHEGPQRESSEHWHVQCLDTSSLAADNGRVLTEGRKPSHNPHTPKPTQLARTYSHTTHN